MPLYMDRHDTAGVTAEDVAAAHVRDLEVQGKYGVHYLNYWFDPDAGQLFCFADAPNMEAAEAVHREAHGFVASKIIEVDNQAVHGFLGHIETHPPGVPYVETAFRAILFTDIEGSTTLTERLGDAHAMQVLRTHDLIVRKALDSLGGSEVKHTGDGIMASFASVNRAIESAIAIQRGLAGHNRDAENPIGVRIGLSAGEPVTEHDDFFGAAVQLAARICNGAHAATIFVSNAVRELCIGKGFTFEDRGAFELKGFAETVQLFEVRWR